MTIRRGTSVHSHHLTHTAFSYNCYRVFQYAYYFRPVRRVYRVSMLTLLFIAAVSPSILFASRRTMTWNDRSLRVKGSTADNLVSPVVVSTLSMNGDQTNHIDSCIVVYLPRNYGVIDSTMSMLRNVKRYVQLTKITVDYYISFYSSRNQKAMKEAKIVIVTDNSSIVTTATHIKKANDGKYHWFLLDTTSSVNKPHGIEQLSQKLQDLSFIESCTIVLYDSSTNQNAEMSHPSDNVVVTRLATVLRDVTRTKVNLLDIDSIKSSTTTSKPATVLPKLNTAMTFVMNKRKKLPQNQHDLKIAWSTTLGKIGSLPCRVLSDRSRQGLCDRWFHS